MFVPLFAANWDDLIKIASFLVVGLYYLITMFAKKAKVQPPPRPRPLERIPMPERPEEMRPEAARPQPGHPASDPLQAEINDFLRQSQAQREGRGTAEARPLPPPLADAPRRPRPKRRQTGGTIKRDSPRRPYGSPVQPMPVVVEVVASERPRESLAEQLAQRKEVGVFDQSARPLSQRQQASDSEFQQHMQKVFDHQLGTLKPTATLGMFEAAGAAAAAVATQTASANAAAAQSSTAPVTIHKSISDISHFLAGKKNVRDAVILAEILKRPEDRW